MTLLGDFADIFFILLTVGRCRLSVRSRPYNLNQSANSRKTQIDVKSNTVRQTLANYFSHKLPSGGLNWHIRAFLFNKQWEVLKHSVSKQLADWKVSNQTLLLLGPSAGWTLPKHFLNRFSQIEVMDLDPLAKRLFCKNHPALKHKLQWQQTDYLQHLPQWLGDPKNANTPLLFCNTLGQRGLHTESVEQTLADIANLQQWLRHHSWGSYHDRLSLQLPVRCNRYSIVKELCNRVSAVQQTGTLPTEQLLSLLKLHELQGINGLPLEVTDHCTETLLPASAPRSYSVWPLSPRKIHIVEMGFSNVKTPTNLLHWE